MTYGKDKRRGSTGVLFATAALLASVQFTCTGTAFAQQDGVNHSVNVDQIPGDISTNRQYGNSTVTAREQEAILGAGSANAASIQQNGAGGSASVTQQGQQNAAGIAQYGVGDKAVASQYGTNLGVQINQYSNGASVGVTQYGVGTLTGAPVTIKQF